jgi:hypothetical protein
MNRFKNEAEFIAEFKTKHWRECVPTGWSLQMDYALGKPQGYPTPNFSPKPYHFTPIDKENEPIYRDILKNALSSMDNCISCTRENVNSQLWYIAYLYDISHLIFFYINQSPTHNCQLTSVASFDALLSTTKTHSRYSALQILTHISKKYTHQSLMLFDINQSYLPELKEFEFKIPPYKYTSTNRSSMAQGMIKLNLKL